MSKAMIRTQHYRNLILFCTRTFWVLPLLFIIVGCQRHPVNPGELKWSFGRQVFALVKDLNEGKKAATHWGTPGAVSALDQYANQVTEIQFDVESQHVDPFNRTAILRLAARVIYRPPGQAPVLTIKARFKIRWKQLQGKWRIVSERRLR